MKLIISDNIIKWNIINYTELSKKDKDKHTMGVFRSHENVHIPRVGEVVLWHNNQKLLVETVMYEYEYKSTSGLEDAVYVFGSIM